MLPHFSRMGIARSETLLLLLNTVLIAAFNGTVYFSLFKVNGSMATTWIAFCALVLWLVIWIVVRRNCTGQDLQSDSVVVSNKSVSVEVVSFSTIYSLANGILYQFGTLGNPMPIVILRVGITFIVCCALALFLLDRSGKSSLIRWPHVFTSILAMAISLGLNIAVVLLAFQNPPK